MLRVEDRRGELRSNRSRCGNPVTTHSIYRLRIRGPGGSAGRSTRPGAADLSGVDYMECCSGLRTDTTPIAEARPCSGTCRRVPNCSTPDISAAAGNLGGGGAKRVKITLRAP